MSRDPAREVLDWTLVQTEKHIESATQGILRGLSGRVAWTSDHVRRHRGELERALIDRQLIQTAPSELDRMDAEIGR